MGDLYRTLQNHLSVPTAGGPSQTAHFRFSNASAKSIPWEVLPGEKCELCRHLCSQEKKNENKMETSKCITLIFGNKLPWEITGLQEGPR